MKIVLWYRKVNIRRYCIKDKKRELSYFTDGINDLSFGKATIDVSEKKTKQKQTCVHKHSGATLLQM